MEYHFPTRRGENRVRHFSAEQIEDGGDLIHSLLEWLRRGWFPPTDHIGDCRYCDYRDLCWVRAGSRGTVTSPLVAWSNRQLGELPELEALARVRNWER